MSETTAAPVTVDAERLTRVYMKIRDARAQRQKEFDEQDKKLKEQLAKLEGVMLKLLNDTGAQSIRTESGTVYKQEDVVPRADDWGAVYAFVVEHDAFDLLERRVKKTFVKEYMEQHDGAMPPGISVMRSIEVRVRKS